MDEDQVWSQLDLRTNSICEVLDNVLDKEPDEDELDEDGLGSEDDEGEDDDDDDEISEKLREAIQRIENGEDVDFDQLGLDGSEKELLLDLLNSGFEDGSDLDDDDDDEEGDVDLESEEDGDEVDENAEEKVALRDPSDDSDDDEGEPSLMEILAPKQKKKRTGGNPELDDDFFDLSAFNAQTEQAEAKNASSGNLDDEDEDEEEDLDLFAPIDLEEGDEDDTDNPSSTFLFIFFYIRSIFNVFTCYSAILQRLFQSPKTH